METKTFKNIDEYIEQFSPDIQNLLQQVRQTIKEHAPDASEVISYSMPAFKKNGVLVYFAAFKNHIGFYPTASGISVFESELTGYKTSKGAVQFPYKKEIPYKLIGKIVAFRVLEDADKIKRK